MPFSAVLAFSEVFRVPFLQGAEVTVNFETLVPHDAHLPALWNLEGTLNSVIIEALDEGFFVWETGEFVVGLSWERNTLYS